VNRIHIPVPGSRRALIATVAAGLAVVAGATAATAAVTAPAPAKPDFTFKLAAAKGIASCLPHAGGKVTIVPEAASDTMKITISGLPAVSRYALFDLQEPTKPFGVATFLTYMTTGHNGSGTADVEGIFDSRTFSLSLGGTATFAPVHQYHLGLWFTDPSVPFKLGCEPGVSKPVVTPFDGSHNAGILVLGTAQFPVNKGPLSHVVN
jgi:hypothetical protein